MNDISHMQGKIVQDIDDIFDITYKWQDFAGVFVEML